MELDRWKVIQVQVWPVLTFLVRAWVGIFIENDVTRFEHNPGEFFGTFDGPHEMCYVQFEITVSSSQKKEWLSLSIERIVSASNVLAVCLLKIQQPFCLLSAQKIKLVNEIWYHRLYLGVWSWPVLNLLIEAWIGIFLGNEVLITPNSYYLWHNHNFGH